MILPTPGLPGKQALYLASNSQAQELRGTSGKDYRDPREECHTASCHPDSRIQAYLGQI